MKKKHARTKANQPAAPQSMQLNAVRKLSRSGKYEEALARLAELRARYPDFKPLLALAWEVEDNAGNFLLACLQAWDWSAASPGSLAALDALRDSAFSAGMPALGALAVQKLAQAEGKPFPDLPPLDGALADTTFEQAVAIDLSRLFLSCSRFDEAVEVLKDIDHPSARNNLALARFAQGDVEAARAGLEANWRQDPRNLFALNQLVRLRLWRGGRDAANELVDVLRDAQPLRLEDAYGKMFGLLLLGLNDEAIDAWNVLREAEFWDEEVSVEQSSCAYFAGLAALRKGKGDMENAARLFSEALDIDPDNKDADTAFTALALRSLGKEFDLKAGEFHDWFPQSWILEVKAAKGEQAMEAVLEAQQGGCDAHADYLAVAAELGGFGVRVYAISILKLRALNGDTVALDALRSLLFRPCGPDKVRLDLNIWLQENGLVETGQIQKLLLHGEVQELVLRPMRLHAERKDIGLPATSQAKLEQMHRLLAKPDLRHALGIAEELAAAHPGNPTLVGNIASIKEALGYDLDEIEAQYQRTAALDPGYLFAQAGLARVAARKGDVERARELLKSLHGREEYHFTEWRTLLMVEREIALAQEDMAALFKVEKELENLMEQFG